MIETQTQTKSQPNVQGAKPEIMEAAVRLHGYLLKRHWNGHALEGPDPGVRFNWRVGRFVKGYLDFLPWHDNLVYMQGQGYWILGNYLMADLLGGERYAEIALAGCEYVLRAQQPEGYWEYPNPEWKGRIATVEGDFAALGLLAGYSHSGREALMDGVKKWHRYLVDKIGFQGSDGLLAVNYFANTPGDTDTKVPNNSALMLRTLARLARTANDEGYLSPYRGMVPWLKQVQLETGELPYRLSSSPGVEQHHFLCYQYNAYEFLELAEYYRLTGDREVYPILEGLSAFLSGGITASGAARYDCHHERPEMPYYTAATAAALSQATALGLGDYGELVARACDWLLSLQRADGGIEFFSRGNYGFLTDRRSYPRAQAMILYHLLSLAQGPAANSVLPAAVGQIGGLVA
jgi:hypothetical protein